MFYHKIVNFNFFFFSPYLAWFLYLVVINLKEKKIIKIYFI